MSNLFSSGRKKAVFFDVHGTLISHRRAFYQHLKEVLGEFFIRLSGNHEDILQQALARYRSEWEKRHPQKKKVDFSQVCLEKALSNLPFPDSPAFFSYIDQRMKEQKRNGTYGDPSAVQTVKALHSRYMLGIISNGQPDSIMRLLEKNGLTDYFPPSRIFAPSERVTGKPHPRIFSEALKGMNVKGNEAVMVGDSWKNDVSGAVRAGMDAIWLRQGANTKSPLRLRKRTVFIVEQLPQILNIL